LVCFNSVRLGLIDPVWLGWVRFGLVQFGSVKSNFGFFGSIQFDVLWCGLVWSGTVRFDWVRFSLVGSGLFRFGLV